MQQSTLGRRWLPFMIAVIFSGCSSIPVTPLRGQDGDTTRRDQYVCSGIARQAAWVQKPVEPTATTTAANVVGLGAMLAGAALEIAGAAFGITLGLGTAGAFLVDMKDGTATHDPERERIAYAACMEPRGYAVDIGSAARVPKETVQCPGTSQWNGYGCTSPVGTPVGRSSPAEREATRAPAPAVPPAPAIVPKTTVTPDKPAATPAAAVTPLVSGPRSSMIPIQVIENVVLVPATLNRSHGAMLLLDTGASKTILTPALAARLNLTPRPGVPTHSFTGFGGQTVEVPFIRLPVLEIGDVTLVDIEVGVYARGERGEGWPIIDGILGGDVLSRYRVTVDHSARQLRLDPVPCRAIVCK